MNPPINDPEQKRQCIFVYVVFLIGVLGAVITWQLFRKIEQQQTKALEASLETILKTTSGGLQLWADAIHEIADAALTTPIINEAIRQNLKTFDRSHTLPPKPLRMGLDQALSPRIKSHHFLNYALLANDGTQISGDPINLGTKNLSLKAAVSIEAAQKSGFSLSLPFYMDVSQFRSTKPAGTRIAMVAVVPVRDSSKKNLGSLIIYLDPTTKFDWLAQLAQMGQSGETYIVDRYGRMATQSRFANQLQQIGISSSHKTGITLAELRDPGGNLLDGFKPKIVRASMPYTAMAQSLMHGRSGTNINGYRDYRGVNVVGSWIWMNDLGFGIATEIDKWEAYESWYTLEKMLALFALLSILAASTIFIIREFQMKAVKANLALREETDQIRKESELARKESDQTRAELMTVIAHDFETSIKYYSMKYHTSEKRMVR